MRFRWSALTLVFSSFVAYTRWPSVSGKPIWWLKFARLAFVASKLFMSWAALRWCELGRLPSLIISVGIGINIDCIWRSLFTLFSWFCWFLFGSLRMPGGRLLGLLLYSVPAPLLTISGIIFVVCVTSGGGIMLWFIAIRLLFLLFNVLLRAAFMWFNSELVDMLWGSVADATE